MKLGGILLYRLISSINQLVIHYLPTQYPCKDQRRNNRCIALYNEFWRVDIKFTPGNFFVGNCTAVRTKRCSGITDLAEITPERNIMPFKILVHHGYNANRKITCNTTTNLEKANAFATAVLAIPIS
jgi:hypothetical protein